VIEMPGRDDLDGLADPETLPSPTAVSAPYFAAAARGELIFQRCDRGHAFLYPRSLCPSCHSSELTWERSAGRGEVVTFAPVHRPPWDDLLRPVPYVVVLVRLAEGPQLLSTLERVDPGDVRIALPVRAVFEQIDEEVGLVRFAPVG
jgi:uncharacterized protein